MLPFSHLTRSLTISIAMTAILAGCGSSNDKDDDIVIIDPPQTFEAQYQITVANLTSAQPFSPVGIILHDTGALWEIGQPASTMLEKLAESGDNSDTLAAEFAIDTASGTGIMPGQQVEIMVSTNDISATNLSLVTMLVNTNDAFTGLNRIDLSQLVVDDTLNFSVAVYDAGTEANTELAETIPGQGGEGFNETREDVNLVARHPGIVSFDDGLTTSSLNNEHKFDNPVALIKILRVK